MMSFSDFLLIFGSAFVGLFISFVVFSRKKFDEAKAVEKVEHMVLSAEKENKQIKLKARERKEEAKKQFVADQQRFEEQNQRMEKIFGMKNASLQKRELKNQKSKQDLQNEEHFIGVLRAQTADLINKTEAKLLHITGLQKETGRDELIRHYEETFCEDAEMRVSQDVEWTQECAVKEGKNILSGVIYRYSHSNASEHEYAKVMVPRDEIKGRIVGRSGKNIAFFEDFFGVDVVFNDEPNTIFVGCFNLVQREVARIALEKLIREKNISEEVIAKLKPAAEHEMDRILKREGEAAVKPLGQPNLPVDFIKLVGRLKFRTSYGQNVLRHSFEVGFFARMLAEEIGANKEIAWAAGFLHDIGKAVDQETGGSHDQLTKEILGKYGFSKEVVHAAWTHHNSIPQETIEAQIVQAADAISAGRPGARAESLEHYLAKIKDLQDTAVSFAGVKKAYAINAGREVRVIVESEKIKDPGMNLLAAQIAGKVQEKGGYPGKIKITTIRVTKTTDYAK